MSDLIIYERIYINGVESKALQSELTRKIIGQDEDGNDILGDTYTYYNEDLTPDLVSEEQYIDSPEPSKEQKLEDIIVNVNQVDYDAHTQGVDNMSAVISVANMKFNKAICVILPELQSVYDAIYKQTKTWKGADNEPHAVQIESVGEALEKAMLKRAGVYGVN